MVVEDLDLELRAKLGYSDIPQNKVTIIYVPGLGTMGGASKKIALTHKRLLQRGMDLNVVNFTYKSHLGKVLSGFENDSKDLSEIVKRLEDMGIPRDKIGLFSVCYGSHVASQFLSENKGIGFAIMVEPYLGTNSLRRSLRGMASLAKYALRSVRLPKIPIGHRYDGNGYIDVQSFVENDGVNIDFNDDGVPILTLITKVHWFINPNYYLNPETKSHTVVLVDTQKISKTALNNFYGRIYQFLAEIYSPEVLRPTTYSNSKTLSETLQAH